MKAGSEGTEMTEQEIRQRVRQIAGNDEPASMRVIADAGLEDRFVDEARRSGVTDGFGVRATKAISKAEAMPLPAPPAGEGREP